MLAMMVMVPFQQALADSHTDAVVGTADQSDSNDKFTISLDGVDIRSLIETVTERTGKGFIVDPRVKATVTVVSSKPIDADELYELFLSVLDVHGFAAVKAGSLIKIVPTTDGVKSAIPLVNEQAAPNDELVTRVIPVQNGAAQPMVESLRPLLSASASISAELTTNTIIITDTAANIDRLEKLIQSLDGTD